MKIRIKGVLFLLLLSLCAMGYASDLAPVIRLNKWQGSVLVSAPNTDDITVFISDLIAPGKVVVASIDGEQLPDTNKFVLQLYNARTGQMVKEAFGRRYKKSRMTYFVTSGEPAKYYLKITPNQAVPEFEVRVKLVEKLGPFRKLDSKENPSELFTYFMSNSPEFFEKESECLGENGWYLARGRLQGNANVYWEHCNYLGYDARFGVLLWNKEPQPVTVRLNSTSAKSWTDAGSMEPAMCGVWLDWLKGKMNDNELADDFRKPFVLPAYNPANPSASAKWILLHTVEKNDPVKNTFNGLINLSLTDQNGQLYSGNLVFCDTYIMKKGKEDHVLHHVAGNDIVPTKDALRGSGAGAMVETTIPVTEITPDKPFCFLMTGFDPPRYQEGENVVTYYQHKDGTTGTLPTAYGYAVVYKFNFSGFKSAKPIKARYKFNPYTNLNVPVDKWAGMYVVGKRQYDGAIFSKLVMANQDYVFDENVPLDCGVTYCLIMSGMSSLPLEVEFYND